MTDRQKLANLIDEHRSFRRTDQQFGCYACLDRAWVDHDGFAEHLAVLIAAQFVLIPAEEMAVEYGAIITNRGEEPGDDPAQWGCVASGAHDPMTFAYAEHPIKRVVGPWERSAGDWMEVQS